MQAIATSAMGPSAVLECTQDSPNLLATTLAPRGGGGDVFVVTLAALSRQQSSDTLGLYTSEMARQTVRLDTEDLRVAPAVKEVETTTLFYTQDAGEGFRAFQKTSSYLVRGDPRERASMGKPVDVRCYEVTYTRKMRG